VTADGLEGTSLMSEKLDQEFQTALDEAEKNYASYLESAGLAQLTSVALATLHSAQTGNTAATAATFTFGCTPS
jgi:hypothetical protein